MKKRVLAWMLVVLMLASILAIPAAADDSTDTDDSGVSTVEEGGEGGSGGSEGGSSGSEGGSSGSEGGGSGSEGGGSGSEGGSSGSEGGSSGSEGGSSGSEGGSSGSEGGSDGSEGGSSGSEGGSSGSEGGSSGSEGGSDDSDDDSDSSGGDAEGDPDCKHAWVYVEIDPTCTEYGAKGYGCGYCGAVKDVVVVDLAPHTYDNACDTSCNVCKATRSIEHNYSSQWSKNSTKHWHACKVCGEADELADHYPGPAATEEKAQYCLTCGLMMMPQKSHVHKYATEYSSDATEHWYACTGCDERKDVALHTFDNLCDPDCNDCGYTTETAHSFEGSWKSDASGHWATCILCGEEKTLEAHVPGPEATDTQPQLCKICSYELAPALTHTHEAGENWEHDEQSHWKTCSCGEKQEVSAHSWEEADEDEGGILYVCQQCGAQHLEEKLEEESGGFPWWILLIVLGIVMIGALVALIVVLVKGNESKGKFHK